MSDKRACPCLYLDERCHPYCTCKNGGSSYGCEFCCSYGSLEQRRDKAIKIAARIKNETGKSAYEEICDKLINPLDGIESHLQFVENKDEAWKMVQSIVEEMKVILHKLRLKGYDLPSVKDEYIVCSAIKYEEGIVCGLRHNNCISIYAALTGKSTSNQTQGFLTSKNRFVDREEGGRIALACGQIKELRYYNGEELDSSDLYQSVIENQDVLLFADIKSKIGIILFSKMKINDNPHFGMENHPAVQAIAEFVYNLLKRANNGTGSRD